MLSQEEVDKFDKDGYLVIESFLTEQECDQLKAAIIDTIDRQLDLETHPRTLFVSHHKDMESCRNEYFLNSGDGINFFFEDGAFSSDTGELLVSKYEALNKIGHALHTDVPEYKDLCQGDKVKDVCKSLGLQHPILPQSMYIFKAPHLGGEVNPHKDSTFLHTGGTRLIGFWIPLDDACEDNGCLWFMPGSHREASTFKMNRNSTNTACVFSGSSNEQLQRHEDYVCVPTKRGSLVLIHGDVAHKSYKNVSSQPRNAFTFHLYEGEGSNWEKSNWNQPTDKATFVQLY